MSTRLEPRAVAQSAGDEVQLTYREAIRAALEDEMAGDGRVLLLGEDVANTGGVFKTNEGLPEHFPGRVLNTPICENTFLGVALGMAVTGLRPVVEIMFSDFLPTAGDALVEELPKYRFMSGGQVSVPLTIRAIGGGGGRFGTQHSATGESWFIGLPGLKVAAAGTPGAAYGLLRAAIRDENPVLFFEHKTMYGRKGAVARGEAGIAEIGKAQVERTGADVTILSTLLMTEHALRAADELMRDGIAPEVIELRWLRPLDLDTIRESVEKTGRLVLVHEEVTAGSWASTVIAELTVAGHPWTAPPRLVGLPDDVLVPYSPPLEDTVIPSVAAISDAVRAAVT